MPDHTPLIEEIVQERGESYGKPLENHRRTARLWDAFLKNRSCFHRELEPEEVCFLNILQKISRSQSKAGPSLDSIQDISGYANNILEIMLDMEILGEKERDQGPW